MAKRQITQLIDDLDGTVLEDGEGTTIRFALEGRSYDIDLSGANAEKLREALAPYIEVASPVSASAVASRSRGRSKTGSAGKDLAAVREWARANGHKVSDRGRVPARVLEAYEASNA